MKYHDPIPRQLKCSGCNRVFYETDAHPCAAPAIQLSPDDMIRHTMKTMSGTYEIERLRAERDRLIAQLRQATPRPAEPHRIDEAPVLTLSKRTPAEAKAYRDGARLAVNLILGRLQGVVKHPADATVPTADVRAACEYAHGLIQSADEIAAVTPEDAARGYGVEVDDG